mgnify:CR=1 FL=1|jgi:hypothetical protein
MIAIPVFTAFFRKLAFSSEAFTYINKKPGSFSRGYLGFCSIFRCSLYCAFTYCHFIHIYTDKAFLNSSNAPGSSVCSLEKCASLLTPINCMVFMNISYINQIIFVLKMCASKFPLQTQAMRFGTCTSLGSSLGPS